MRYFLLILSFLPFYTSSALDSDSLYFLSCKSPSETESISNTVAVAAFVPDGVIVTATPSQVSGLNAIGKSPIYVGEWQERTHLFVTPLETLPAGMVPLFTHKTWALVDDDLRLQQARVHYMELKHGLPYKFKAAKPVVSQNPQSVPISSLTALVNGIQQSEIQSRIIELADYGTRYAPTTQSHQAVKDMADVLIGLGYEVSLMPFIYPTINDMQAGFGGFVMMCGDHGALFQKNSEGGMFTQLAIPEEYRDYFLKRLAFDSGSGDTNIVITTDSGLLISKDNGVTWSFATPGGAVSYTGVCVGSSGGFYCLTEGGKLFVTDHTLASWAEIAIPPEVTDAQDICCYNSNLLIAADCNLYYSTDAGVTWNTIWESDSGRLKRVSMSGDDFWAAGLSGTILHSRTDSIDMHKIPIDADNKFWALCDNGLDGALVAGDNGRLFHINRATETVTPIPLDIASRIKCLDLGIISSSEKYYLGGSDGTVMFSNGNYNNWTDISNGFNPDSSLVWSNVIAEKPGVSKPGEVIIASAHIDSIASGAGYDPWTLAPGADDNASGSASVIALANAYKNYPTTRTIRFILFNGEEEGLIGSYRYVNHVANLGDCIHGVYNMDMTAYNWSGSLQQDLVGNNASSWLVDYARSCGKRYVPELALRSRINDGFGYSDHAPFWYAGIPALLCIETWDTENNPYYHSPQDTPDKLDFYYSLLAARVAAATVGELAQPSNSPVPDTLSDMIVFPNPYKPLLGHQFITFEGVPTGSEVKIYDITGDMISKFTGKEGYRITWQPMTNNGSSLASGVYLFVVTSETGEKKTGKITIIN